MFFKFFILLSTLFTISCENKFKEYAMSNKEKAKAVLQSLATGDPQAITEYVSANLYIQHNPNFPDGRQALLNALPSLKENGTKVKIKRIFEDENYVFLHTQYFIFGKDLIGFDIFRFEHGKIVEHWDNLTPLTPNNSSNHSQIDGPTISSGSDKTQFNKTLIKNFIEDILMGKNPNKINDYIGEIYIQHNSNIADGLDGLMKAFEKMKNQNISMVFENVHYIIGEANFVLSVSEGKFASNPVAFYDLFRIENNKIIEHWDVIETISLQSEQKNQNGKF